MGRACSECGARGSGTVRPAATSAWAATAPPKTRAAAPPRAGPRKTSSSTCSRRSSSPQRFFVQMYANVVLGIEHGMFEEILETEKETKGVELDTELDAADLRKIASLFRQRVAREAGRPFPEDVHEQLWGAIGAVFGSWQSPRGSQRF